MSNSSSFRLVRIEEELTQNEKKIIYSFQWKWSLSQDLNLSTLPPPRLWSLHSRHFLVFWILQVRTGVVSRYRVGTFGSASSAPSVFPCRGRHFCTLVHRGILQTWSPVSTVVVAAAVVVKFLNPTLSPTFSRQLDGPLYLRAISGLRGVELET